MGVEIRPRMFLESLLLEEPLLNDIADIFFKHGWEFKYPYGYFRDDVGDWTFEETEGDMQDEQRLEEAISNVVEAGGGALLFQRQGLTDTVWGTSVSVSSKRSGDYWEIRCSMSNGAFWGENEQRNYRIFMELVEDLVAYISPYVGHIDRDTSSTIFFEGDFTAPPNGFTGVTYLSYDVPEVPVAELADADLAPRVVEYQDGVLFEACQREEGSPPWICDPDEVTDLEEFLGLDYLYQ